MSDSHNNTFQQKEELSIWSVLYLLKKNWILAFIVITLFVCLGLFYSFIVQEQGQISYTSQSTVLYSSWEHYPPKIMFTYTKDLKTYVNNKVGKSSISSITILPINSSMYLSTNKKEFYISITYSPSMTYSEAENAAQLVAEWHNNMMNEEAARIKENGEQSLKLLYENYEKEALEYYTFISNADMSDINSIAKSDLLESAKDIAYEMWKGDTTKLQTLNNELNNISEYYIDSPSISNTIKITWKTNLIASIFIGLVLAVIIILLKGSYMEYCVITKKV